MSCAHRVKPVVDSGDVATTTPATATMEPGRAIAMPATRTMWVGAQQLHSLSYIVVPADNCCAPTACRATMHIGDRPPPKIHDASPALSQLRAAGRLRLGD